MIWKAVVKTFDSFLRLLDCPEVQSESELKPEIVLILVWTLIVLLGFFEHWNCPFFLAWITSCYPVLNSLYLSWIFAKD